MTEGLTDAEKLAALETYIRALEPIAKALRAKVTADMGMTRTERVGAYLPDGTKLASVGYSGGRTTTKVTDVQAAVAWCEREHPDMIVKAINPAYLKALGEYSRKIGKVGDKGVDPETGERLDFLEVVQGNPYITVTATDDGVERMQALAGGFAGMLSAAS